MSDKVRILYIDDDAGLGRLLQRALASSNFDVHPALTGAEGLRRLQSETFDLVALDHNLITETGLDLIPKIKAMPDAPPIIYVTGSEDVRVAVAALKAGAVDYVWKDVQGHYRDLLREAIIGALEQEKLKREQEEAQRQIREARDRAEAMLKEVNHRVANSLALVSSLAQLQSSAVKDPAAKEALKEMQARIAAIAGIHRRLYTSQDVGQVELDAYLASLVEDIAAAIGGTYRHKLSFKSGGSVLIATDKAVSLGVIVTELVTNAYKYAYPDGRAGEIRVSLAKEDGSQIRLVVADDGVGWDGEGPAKGTGLGSRVIRAMAANFQARVAYTKSASGTRAELCFTV
jgi:two-component sensor histidine kinase